VHALIKATPLPIDKLLSLQYLTSCEDAGLCTRVYSVDSRHPALPRPSEPQPQTVFRDLDPKEADPRLRRPVVTNALRY